MIKRIMDEWVIADRQFCASFKEQFSFLNPTLEDRIEFLEGRLNNTMSCLSRVGQVLSSEEKDER